MINNLIDLHTHSTASDGTFSPAQLAEYAYKKGLRAIALTDHDTVDGIYEFSQRCFSLGIEPIAGVEISARYKCEMHIVGLFIDTKNKDFCQNLNALKNARLIRNEKMLKLLEENGMHITAEDLLRQKENASLKNIGRPHIARAMVEHGYVHDIKEAFDKYIAHGECCYVKRLTYSPEESIQLIKSAGGIAILAHPIYITDDEQKLFDILKELKGFGLDGVECFYSTYTEAFSKLCIRLCKRLELIPSGGSDFHGSNKQDIDLGCVNISYDVLKNMKQYMANKVL